MRGLEARTEGQNSFRTVTNLEWKGKEGTFSSVGGASENGARGEKKTQAFGLPNSVLNPNLGDEVGACC